MSTQPDVQLPDEEYSNITIGESIGESDVESDKPTDSDDSSSSVTSRSPSGERAILEQVDDVFGDGTIDREAALVRSKTLGPIHVCDYSCDCDASSN